MAHIFARPFEDAKMDWMEFFSLMTSFVTFWVGQFLFVGGISNSERVLFSILIVSFNVGFAVAGLATVALAFKDKAKVKPIDQVEMAAMKEATDTLNNTNNLTNTTTAAAFPPLPPCC